MSENTEITKERRYIYTQNREISWLRFNSRVLDEAADENVPALERLKFVSIFSTNIDEFFMIRVGSILDMSEAAPQEKDNKSGLNPRQQLDRIYRAMPSMLKRKEHIYRQVCSQLEGQGVYDLSYEELSHNEKKYINKYFSSRVLPVLSPQIIDSRHPTPKFSNKLLYVASLVSDKRGKKSVAFVPVASVLPRVVMLSEEGRFIRTENIIRHWAPKLYEKYIHEESCIISVTRNADVSFDTEKFDDDEPDMDFRSYVKKMLRKRAVLNIVRLEVGEKISEEFMAELKKTVNTEHACVCTDRTPLDMKYVFDLEGSLKNSIKNRLTYAPYTPKWPCDIDRDTSVIKQIQQKDRLLFFPFDSVEPFIRLLNEAAENESVVSIKITIYRLASSSKIVRALCRAAENGKEVVVLMELRARFDEANNIGWSKMLEDSGCKVLYGIENFKCHSKICLITLREKSSFRYITQIGTGNYNEKTNALYTDLSLMTANDDIGCDGAAFFRNMLTGNLEGKYQHLLVAPRSIRSAVCSMIDREINKGSRGYICMKVNSVTDRAVIDKLAEASKAGVDIQLIVRGICCIRAGIAGETENLTVTSIVGRFLEHARIYCFGRGSEVKMFISSADMMTRNLSRRVEIACPIYDEELKKNLSTILRTQLNDTAKASVLKPDGSYIRKKEGQEVLCDSQQKFMESTLHKKTVHSRGFRSIWNIMKHRF